MPDGTIEVGNDAGGFLRRRVLQLEELRGNGHRIEVRGKYCYSTCTLYLGLPQTCVMPYTDFGFHGPSRYGLFPLPDDIFEVASQLMASYYPAPLRRWYLSTARYRRVGVHIIKGSQLIAIGVPSCPAAGS